MDTVTMGTAKIDKHQNALKFLKIYKMLTCELRINIWLWKFQSATITMVTAKMSKFSKCSELDKIKMLIGMRCLNCYCYHDNEGSEGAIRSC